MMNMIKVIHVPSGEEKTLNQTHANRLIEYSKKYGRGWEFVKEKVQTKKAPKLKKNEDTIGESSSGNIE